MIPRDLICASVCTRAAAAANGLAARAAAACRASMPWPNTREPRPRRPMWPSVRDAISPETCREVRLGGKCRNGRVRACGAV